MSEGYEYFRIAENEPLPDVSAFRTFKALVVINSECSIAWQARASKWLVDSGCMYMLAWGPGCSTWDDSVDWANLEEFDYGDIPSERFVMTSWHEREPLDEVMWFAHFHANAYDDAVELRHTLIIDVGSENRREEMLARFRTAIEQG